MLLSQNYKIYRHSIFLKTDAPDGVSYRCGIVDTKILPDYLILMKNTSKHLFLICLDSRFSKNFLRLWKLDGDEVVPCAAWCR